MKEKINKLMPYLKYAASCETAYRLDYEPRIHPLHNHCGCVAYVIQKLFGGEQMGAKKHIWNRIDGTEYDVTRNDREYAPVHKGVRLPERKTVNPRFQIFHDRVIELLHKHPEDLS